MGRSGRPPVDEQRLLDDLFAGADDPILLIDPASDRVHRANTAACVLLGYEHADLLAAPLCAVQPAERSALETFLSKVSSDGHGWTIGLTWKTSAGRFLPAETVALRLIHDRRLYVLMLVTDVSDHRHRVPVGP